MRDEGAQRFLYKKTKSINVCQVLWSTWGVPWILVFCLMGTGPGWAQNQSYRILSASNESGGTSSRVYPGERLVAEISHGSGSVITATLDPHERLDVIVELQASPSSLPETRGEGAAARTAIQDQQARFVTDVESLQQRLIAETSRPGTPAVIRRRFEYLYNGVALTAERRLIEEIQRLPYVHRVHDDTAVELLLDESVPLIGAEAVWRDFGFTGEGVVVGVIDTGIDYLHPDLGGGIGTEHKVVGGYDFVNDDPDPMDDHGHGTAVAGIIAAQGPGLRGVAPDARLLALKVVDAGGGALSSDIIAALEYAIDPDGDPATDDAVEVINISLGTVGHADDPVSRAVDNAVASGVVCVVAAGNDGQYFGIRSPGTARKAITVGASNKQDAVTNFSSRGPNPGTFEIKPELVAPGDGIQTTVLGGGHGKIGGTSAAAPHVAGAVALLRQKYPNRRPEATKATLMQSARDLGAGVFAQGAGRVDIYAAVRRYNVITPPAVDLGLVDTREEVWSEKRTLLFTGAGQEPEHYRFSVQGDWPAGVEITLEPRSLTLNPGELQAVGVEIRANNDIVPMVGEEPYAYTGRIAVDAGGDLRHIPVAFLKSPQLTLHFDEPPWLVMAHNRGDEVHHFILPGYRFSTLLPEGIYDLLIFYPDGKTQIVREEVPVRSVSTLEIRKAEAVREFIIEPVDENHLPLLMRDGVHLFKDVDSDFEVRLNGALTERRFSPVSAAYLWEWALATKVPPNRVYQFHGYRRGIASNGFEQPGGEALQRFLYHYAPPPDDQELFVLHWMSKPPDAVGSSTFWDAEDPPLRAPFVEQLFIMPNPHPDFSFGHSFKTVYAYEGPPFDAVTSRDDKLYETPRVTVTNASTLTGYLLGEPESSVLETHANVYAGFVPPHWFGRFDNSTDTVAVRSVLGSRLWLFLSQTNDMYLTDHYTYTLRHEGRIVAKDQVSAGSFDGEIRRPVTPGTYTLTMLYENFYVGGTRGRATVRAEFNTVGSDKNPPYLADLEVFSDGLPAQAFESSSDVNMRFTVMDDHGVENVNALYRPEGFETWLPFDLQHQGEAYQGSLPGDVPRRPLDVRLEATDSAGNRLTYTLEPALRLANAAPYAFALLEPAFGDTVRLPTPQFAWQETTDPDGDAVRYALYLGTDSTFADTAATQVVGELRETAFTAADSLLNDTVYFWKVAAIDAHGATTWSVDAPWRFYVSYDKPTTVRAEPTIEGPRRFELHPNVPNPFNPSTTIRYDIARGCGVALTVYNVRGEQVRRLADGWHRPGKYSVLWNGLDDGDHAVASGVYVVRLRAGNYTQSRKVLLLR